MPERMPTNMEVIRREIKAEILNLSTINRSKVTAATTMMMIWGVDMGLFYFSREKIP
jgi:hypothetical protein